MTTAILKAKKSRTLFSAKLAKQKNLPPAKPINLEVRSREYLTSAEVIELRDTARQIGRYGFRDWLLIMIMYRHALRVGEIIDLRWDQIDLKTGKLHVNRLKNGDSSVHYLEGDEVRSLRKLQRDQPASAFVFCSERGGPLTTRTVHNIIARAGREAGFEFPVHPHMLRHYPESKTMPSNQIYDRQAHATMVLCSA